MGRRFRSLCLILLGAGLGATIAPRLWCGRDASSLFDGTAPTQDPLARGVISIVDGGVEPSSFSTGSARFDGEWTVATYQMAVLGLVQVARAHPEFQTNYLPAIRESMRRLLASETRQFGTAAWGEDGLEAHDSPKGHAYLGYINLALGMHRQVDPQFPHGPLHDGLSRALERRLLASPHTMIETYPNETYPPDVSAVVGSLGLHQTVAGVDHSDVVSRFADAMRARFIDPSSGLLHQSVDAVTGEPRDRPRASGTAISVYFLSFADMALSRDLFDALTRVRTSFLGFGGVREFPNEGAPPPTLPLVATPAGDIDSGPVLFGVGLSATGFTLAGARIHGDENLYRELYRTVYLFGAPIDRGSSRRFVTGGPIGNALMLALLTAGAPQASP